MKYDFTAIETKWQAFWKERETFRAPNPGEAGFDPAQPKFYVLDMFPYPSGVGLHVGHPLGYIATDIVARYRRMRGFNVLHPMGYDAFGLPAEQYAVEKGIHPRVTTGQNIANMTRQLQQLGLSYDWSRCISTTDPTYYRWTQWIFLQLYHAWYDPAKRQVRPIKELVAALVNEQYLIDLDGELVSPGLTRDLAAITGLPAGWRKWHELSAQEQRDFLDDRRLAYLAEVPVNWCPMLGTVLANEEVTNDGKSERGNFPVYRRPLKQWMLRITALAERLIDDLELVDWPEATKQMQRHWIGRSEGAYVDFPLALGDASGGDDDIRVFTTRPDTLFGATYMVLAPEHPLVESITTTEQYHAVSEYRRQTQAKADMDRMAQGPDAAKTGVFTGAYAINPVNNAKIPIWIADYVLMGYGTGAIMAVPAHDERDFAFAKKFNLPIQAVLAPPEKWLREHAQAQPANEVAAVAGLLDAYLDDPGRFNGCFSDDGTSVHSANEEITLDGLPTPEAKKAITAWLEKRGLGTRSVQYKLRDWLFSRQRYWGEPFPILHGPEGEIVPVEESALPVLLPEMSDFKPSASADPDQPPQPPLSRAPDSWKYVEKNGVRYTREFNTMPQWAGSCWYYLRYLDPTNDQAFVASPTERYWMTGATPSPSTPSPLARAESRASGPDTTGSRGAITAPRDGVDLYVGGVEHAVLHLLYARFWHKALFDLGHVSTPEPFGRLFNQGYIQAFAYVDERGIYVPAEEVVDQDGRPAMEVQSEPGRKFFHQGKPVTQQYGKMGKSLKNAIAPDEVCAQYGCDTLRLYEMYMGPLDQSKAWNIRDISGVHRFLQRVWRNFVEEETGAWRVSDAPPAENIRRLTHKTIKRVTDAMDAMTFNVAIAALIELNNELVGMPTIPRETATAMVLCLAPLAPHVAEELWQRLGNPTSLARHPWPAYDPQWLVEDTIEYPVQVSGKLRGKIVVPRDANQAAVEAAALADDKVKTALAGKQVKKVIIVPGRMVNIVAG